MTRIALLLLPMMCLSACATGVYSTGTRSPDARQPDALPDGNRGGEEAALPAEPSPSAAATNALIAQSRSERFSGDLGAAAATLERALAIAPDEALLWVELAEIRFDQGDRAEAGELARKALTLTANDSGLARRARDLIGR